MVRTVPKILHVRELIYQSNWLLWSYFVFIAGIFLIPSSKLHNNLYYVLILPPFILVFPFSKIRRFFNSKVYVLSALFIIYLFLTIFWSSDFRISHLLKYGRHAIYTLCFLTLTIDLCDRNPAFYENALRLLGGCGAVGTVISIIVFLAMGPESPHPIPRLEGFGRLENPNIASTVYGLVGLLAYYRFVVYQRRRGLEAVFWWCVIALSLASVALAHSRGPALAALLTLLVGAFFLKQYKLIVFILILPAVYFLLVMLDVVPLAKFFTRDSLRLEIWSGALKDILSSPWLGKGLSWRAAYTTPVDVQPHAHSIFLASLVYGGIVALILLLSILCLATRQAYRDFLKSRDFSLLAAITFVIFCGMTDGYKLVSNPRAMWLYFWFPVAMACCHEITYRKRAS